MKTRQMREKEMHKEQDATIRKTREEQEAPSFDERYPQSARFATEPDGRPGRIKRKRKKRYRIKKKRFIPAIALFCLVFTVATLFFVHRESLTTELRPNVSDISGIPVFTDYIPRGTPARPGELRKISYVVIHETGNAGTNANAASHNNYLHTEASNQTTSWHYTVDDHEIYNHIPDNEIAFHAGDKLTKGGGNLNGIGVEMCVNPENDYEQTLKNAAKLAAYLLHAYDLNIDNLKMHKDFSGKNCPERLLSDGRWEEFKGMVEAEMKD